MGVTRAWTMGHVLTTRLYGQWGLVSTMQQMGGTLLHLNEDSMDIHGHYPTDRFNETCSELLIIQALLTHPIVPFLQI